MTDSDSFNSRSYLTWFLASFFYAFQMTLRVLPGIMMDDIMTNFNLNVGQFGILTGCYYLGYAGSQLPIGLLLDKFHPKYILAGCISLCSLGLMFFAWFHLPIFAYIGRLLIGIGSVAGILGSVKVINEFFPSKYAFMLGLTVLIGVSGAYYGGAPISYLLNYYSASQILVYLALLGLALAAIIIALYQDKSKTNQTLNSSISDNLKACLQHKELWYIGIFSGLMVGPLEGFADVWGLKYYIQAHNLTSNEAGIAISLIFLGMGVGGPAMGYLANKGFNELQMVIACGLLLIVCYLILFFTPFANTYLICTVSLFIGLFSAYQVVVFSIVSKINNNNLVGLMSSLLNMFIMSFGFIFHTVIGYILENWFTSIALGGKEIYSPEAYITAFSTIVIGLLIGSIGFINLKNKLKHVR